MHHKSQQMKLTMNIIRSLVTEKNMNEKDVTLIQSEVISYFL